MDVKTAGLQTSCRKEPSFQQTFQISEIKILQGTVMGGEIWLASHPSTNQAEYGLTPVILKTKHNQHNVYPESDMLQSERNKTGQGERLRPQAFGMLTALPVDFLQDQRITPINCEFS